MQKDGNILVAGFIDDTSGNENMYMAQFLNSGILLDEVNISFHPDDDYGVCLGQQSSGNILLAGFLESLSVVINRFFYSISTPPIAKGLNKRLSVFPNPATKQLNLKYNLKHNTHVNVTLTNLPGKQVATFVNNKKRNAGSHHETFYINKNLNPGLYFLKVQTEESSVTKKIIIR